MNLWELPQEAQVGGRVYPVNADYRDVLDIIAHLTDRERDEGTALYIALALFYEGFEAMPECDYPEAAAWLFRFISGGEEEGGQRPGHKTIDWEQDRAMIVADVNKAAGCEIRALPFCHWWTFLAWFNGIGEGQLSTVVSIREKRRKGKKLTDWERDYYREHKGRVDFRKKYTEEELEEQERLKRLLGE